MTTPSIWPTLTYTDAHAALAFLEEAFGFEQCEVHVDPTDEDLVVHAVLRWPEGAGGVMLSSTGTGDSGYDQRRPGNDSVYAVCADPDAVHERALAAGADIVRPLENEDYGSRTFVARDPEGNLWAFGTYEGS